MSRAKPVVSSSQNKPKQATQSWRDRLAPQDYEELKNTFDIFDQDGSGSIDAVEINKVLEELGMDRRNPLVIGILNKLKQANKSIKFDQFVQIAGSSIGEVKTKDGLRRVFALLDSNEDGSIQFEQFKAGLKSVGDMMNDQDIMQMMHSAFINKKTLSNQAFTFEQFYQVVAAFNNSK